MTKITPEIREQYKALKAKAEAAYLAAAPERAAYEKAMKPHAALLDQMSELVGGQEPEICYACGEPVFEGDPSYRTSEDEVLCAKCAPTYADLTASPDLFLGEDDEPMTAEEAQRKVDAHLAAGGKLTDSLAQSF
ncbi:MAG: hypothetical protein ABFD96_05865 [Armatimonadia bacterium]